MLSSSMPWSGAAAAVAFAVLGRSTHAMTFTPVSSPELDLSNLGRVALTGDFDAISLYSYQGQNEDSFTTNGSQAVLTQMPNGVFQKLVNSDGLIETACPFVLSNGSMQGVVMGGNFTMLDQNPAQGVALWSPADEAVVPLPGLNGSVNTVYCDSTTNSVVVGGSFHGGNSTNAIIWVGSTGWSNMPFAGFDGPVNAITKAPGSQNIVFAGQFSELGNVSTMPTTELPNMVVNLQSSDISAAVSSTQSGFSDPSNIICQTSGQDGPGKTWLAQDGAADTWKVISQYGYEPTRLRLWNTHYQGRGTKTWRFTAFPINGIMNFTYTDPADGQNKSCDAQCPLSNDTNVPYQDFYFVNVIGMTAFQIDMSDWYGAGAGLNGVELVQKANYVYSISQFDQPSCSNTSYPSNATTTGNWQVTPSGQSIANYLTADLTGPGVNSDSASVTFYPDIQEPGNYSVIIFTPGCQQDGSCGARGTANVTGQFTSTGQVYQKDITQTNSFEKYDPFFTVNVDTASSSFRPYVKLQPLDSQNNSISLVALRVRFDLISASNSSSSGLDISSNGTSTLNGLFEYNPNTATVSTDFSKSAINVAGANLSQNALINSLAVIDDKTLYVAGNFSTKDFDNVFAFSGNQSVSLPQGGLNNIVNTMISWGDLLFMGGNFTNTRDGQTSLAQGVVAFDTSSNTWIPMGAGVDGEVTAIVPLVLNLTGQPQACITVNGNFKQVLPSKTGNGFNASGLAIWVPGSSNWLPNLPIPQPAISGQLTYGLNYTANETLLFGTISSQGMAINDVVALSSNSGEASIQSLGLQEPTIAARGQNEELAANALQPNISGAVTGLFVTDNGLNMSVVGGNFATTASNGSTVNNLVFINTESNGTNVITGVAAGLNTNSSFLALARSGTTLYAGGVVTGQVNGADANGLVVWDLGSSSFAPVQPPALGGFSDVSVNSISYRPSTQDVYVGGHFNTAGLLPCSGLCVFTNGQWSPPGRGFSGTVYTMMWQGNDNVLVAGNFTNGGNKTVLANYDATSQAWSTPTNVNQIPGPVTVLTPANSDSSQYWLAGQATNGSTFLMKYDGSNYRTIGPQFGPSSDIRGLSVLSLSNSHAGTDLLDGGYSILVTGQINIPNFGNSSAALFNGTALTPFILANSGNGPGSMSQLVSERQQDFQAGKSGLALGFVVLIALAISLALIGLMVLAGLLLERYRRRREGYRPAPQNYVEKTANMGRIPPDQLLGNLSRGTEGPRV